MSITEEQLLDAIKQIPSEQWSDVLAYLTSLPSKQNAAALILTAADLLKSDLVGAWSDRTDITDNREFARELRRRAENRRGRDHAT